MIHAFRIVKRKYAGTALTGDGAMLKHGRWHTRGTRVVYTSVSRALCAYEMQVHLESWAELSSSYVIVEVMIPDEMIYQPAVIQLPKLWDHDRGPIAAVQRWGDEWAKSLQS